MASPPREVDIAIIGGGLGGLALAAGLTRRGFDVHVFEAAAELRRETSTMIGLGPNGFCALGEIHPDIPDNLKRRGVMNQEAVYHYLPPGREPLLITRDASHTRLCTIRWAETQAVLAELVPSEIVHCGHEAIGYEEVWGEQQLDGEGGGTATNAAADGATNSNGGARVNDGAAGGNRTDGRASSSAACDRPAASRAVVHFRGRPSVVARLVVGADGVFSAIRAAMFPGDPGPRYLGHMNWNCVFPNPGGNTVVDAHKPGQLIVVSDGCIGEYLRDPTTLMYIADAGLGYTFLQVRIQSDEPAFTAPQRAANGAEAEAGAGAGAGALAKEEEECAAVAAAAGDGAGEGDGSGGGGGGDEAQGQKGQSRRRGRGGQGVPGSKARVREVLQRVGWHWAVPVLEAAPESCLFERALYDRLPLPGWASGGGRVALLGDAAHAMHPGPGQGARSAFEDAHQLVVALEALWPDVPAALGSYQRARIVRATRVQGIAAEGVGIASIREAARPAGLSPAERTERWVEFRTWFDQYPNNMDGDPNTKWWKPLGSGGHDNGGGTATGGGGASADGANGAGSCGDGRDGKGAGDGGGQMGSGSKKVGDQPTSAAASDGATVVVDGK